MTGVQFEAKCQLCAIRGLYLLGGIGLSRFLQKLCVASRVVGYALPEAAVDIVSPLVCDGYDDCIFGGCHTTVVL